MNQAFRIALCGLLIVAVAIPAFAGGSPDSKAKSSKVAKIGDTVYQGGAQVLERTEGLFTGCLRNTFSLFNPCLDFVKGCSKVVFAPIEKPLDYLESAYYKRTSRAKGAAPVPEPKKPEIPK
ncbi:MAG TPA: hypothetical protein VK463_13105 [Desulfomonilaceae bacterium]|nr:hypothetical protein [Desulfomonilaceae bacterium]